MAYYEEHMGVEILPAGLKVGNLHVYTRPEYRKFHLPKYALFDEQGLHQGDISTKRELRTKIAKEKA